MAFTCETCCEVRAAKFSPDGSIVLTGAGDGTAAFWSGDGVRLCTLEGHTDVVKSVDFSTCGQMAATASADGTARVWAVPSGKCLQVYRGAAQDAKECFGVFASTAREFSASEQFLGLHQKLADSYLADIANLRDAYEGVGSTTLGVGRQTSPQQTDDKLLANRRVLSTAPSPAVGSQSFIPANVRTLLDEHYEGSGVEREEEDHMPQIDLKPHRYFKASIKEKNISQKRTVSLDALGNFVTSRSQEELQQPKADEASSCIGSILFSKALHPGGHFRTGWNLAVALCVLHDFIFVPLEVFNPPRSLPLTIMEWSTQIFWNFDFLVSLRTGYYFKGALVMDAGKSARHYMRTWMSFDILLISLDWTITWIDASQGIQTDDQ
eukprot:symbB.v1.2.036750.t1/scaffold5259.1/size29278/1